jgi:hypothetical protein
MLYTRCNMQASQRLATVIGSTAFEDLQRGVHFADEELLLVPDEMPVSAVGEFIEDDMVVCVGGSDACVALLPLWSRRGGLREDADPSR